MFSHLNLPKFKPRITYVDKKGYIFDPLRKKMVRLTGEEWVRQHFMNYLIQYLQYPPALIKLEATAELNSQHKRRADMLVFDNKKGAPIMLIECKAPSRRLKGADLVQITQYHTLFQTSFLTLTNGIQHFSYQIDPKLKSYKLLKDVPCFEKINN